MHANTILKGKKDCFGAPHVCAGASLKCLGCKDHRSCATTAIEMVFAASAGVILEGIPQDRRKFVNCVGNFLRDDYIFPPIPLNSDQLKLIEACYARSKHLLPKASNDNDFDKLLADDILEEDTPETAVAVSHFAESSAKVQANVIRLPVCPGTEVFVTPPASVAPETMVAPPSARLTHSEAAAKELSCYSFPGLNNVDDERLSSLGDNELADALKKLVKLKGEDGKLVSYLDIRFEMCGINEIMNRRGVLPPAFRDQRSLPAPKGQKYTDEHAIIMCDRQMIDLAWLHSRGKRDLLVKGEFADLFTSDTLDYDLAEKLVRKGWSAQSKTEKVLNLTPYDQWQMASFRTKVERDKWRNAEVSAESTIVMRLREHAVRNRGFVPHVTEMKLLWLADKIASDKGQKVVAEVFGWLTGEHSLMPSTISAKLKRMRRRTA